MQPIEPILKNIVLGKNQKEYLELPAYYKTHSSRKEMVCAFKLTADEIKKVTETGIIYLSQITGGNLFQPVILSVHEEDVYTREELLFDMRKDNSGIIQFTSMCSRCDKQTIHTIVDMRECDDGTSKLAVGECGICGMNKQDFVCDLLGQTTPEERTQLVQEAWEKDNTYRPFCGNCMCVIRMHHIDNGWACGTCGATGMRTLKEEEL